MIGEKYFARLVNKAAASSLKQLFTGMYNNVPIAPYDNLSQAVYDAYCKSDLIYSIINKKAKAAAPKKAAAEKPAAKAKPKAKTAAPKPKKEAAE